MVGTCNGSKWTKPKIFFRTSSSVKSFAVSSNSTVRITSPGSKEQSTGHCHAILNLIECYTCYINMPEESCRCRKHGQQQHVKTISLIWMCKQKMVHGCFCWILYPRCRPARSTLNNVSTKSLKTLHHTDSSTRIWFTNTATMICWGCGCGLDLESAWCEDSGDDATCRWATHWKWGTNSQLRLPIDFSLWPCAPLSISLRSVVAKMTWSPCLMRQKGSCHCVLTDRSQE